jgi:tRNA(Leu) C34 or U34 (ribose-2'-O)-methylase TrmL
MSLKNAVIDCLESIHARETHGKHTEMTLNKEREENLRVYSHFPHTFSSKSWMDVMLTHDVYYVFLPEVEG